MNSSKHITILCSRLDMPGGIERAVVNTANLFTRKNHSVTLIILDETDKLFYQVEPTINIIQLSLSFGITPEGNIFSRKIRLLSDVLKLRRLLKDIKPDIIISSEYPFTVAAVLAGTKNYSRLFSWEHHHHEWIQKNKFWTVLYNNACKKLDGIICLNKQEADYHKKFCVTHVIPNFVENKSGKTASASTKNILTVGWLIHRKGIDLLLIVAKEVLNQHPDWTWKLIGDGPMKQQVLDFIDKEKLTNRLILQQPSNSSIDSEYLTASLFVLTSRFEAFPMVLLEAMSLGVPCISFDCPSGPSDIITHPFDGILVEKEDIEKLAAAIVSLMGNQPQRDKMMLAAFENVKRFSPEAIYKLWVQQVLT